MKFFNTWDSWIGQKVQKSYISKWGYIGHWHYKYAPDGLSSGGRSDDTNVNSKKNSFPFNETNNVVRTATSKVGKPATPSNSSCQKANLSHIKLNKNNSQQIINNLSKIKTEKSEPQDFLKNLKGAFYVISQKNSSYIEKRTGSKKLVLRLSNHSANGDYVGKNQKETSIVIKLSENQFKNPDKKNIIEYVYEPKNLTKEVKDGIIQGLINWVKTGVYSDTHADSVNKSLLYCGIRIF